jgi:hypothetical protein
MEANRNMAIPLTTYEAALLRVAQLFAQARHPKALGIVHFQREAGQRFRVYPYSLSSQYALRDAKAGESLELVAIAYENGTMDIRNSAVAYRPLSAQDAVALRVGDDLYHVSACGPKDTPVHLFTLGDVPAGDEPSIFSRRCASCGEPILQDGAQRAARAFYTARENEGGQRVRAS